jgi:hypothetical protein
MDLQEAAKFELYEKLNETDKATEINAAFGVKWLPKSVHRILGKTVYVERWFVKKNKLKAGKQL